MRADRDLAAHTLAQLIAFVGVTAGKRKNQGNGIMEEQKNISPEDAFLDYLLLNSNNPQGLSRETYTHCLMYLLKINDIAQEFVSKRGF